jgi:acyl-CoA synthetase (AMP-forming)/AMP-acid ligase II
LVHDVNSLTAPLREVREFPDAVWSTFYDIRRYGGLQILLRALLDGGSLVLSESDERMAQFLNRVSAYGVTHMSGTPSHWRLLLMSGAAGPLNLDYVRLSGEVADQSILDSLRSVFPASRISHAFASTEAGVVFDVADGRAGFPASYVDAKDAPVELKIEYQTLRVRSARTANKYLRDGILLQDEAGFIDTGDVVELRDGRYLFVGRKEGLINVGGLKVHPEEVEAIMNQHPAVQMSLAHGRSSAITGAVVVADIVIRQEYLDSGESFPEISSEIMAACRRVLPAYKVPSRLRAVPFLAISPSGKLLRSRV